MTRRILVVDDDHDHAESLADLLALNGHEASLVFSGEEAVRRTVDRDYDLILLDVRLPGMNGIEAFFAIRAHRPDARIIMMTGLSVEEVVAPALENGALGLLMKPLAIADLLRAITEIPDRDG